MAKLIGIIQKNVREEVRVALDEFKGYDLLNARVWAKKEDGEVVPTKAGFTIRVEQLPDLIAVLQRAEATARADGLLGREAA